MAATIVYVEQDGVTPTDSVEDLGTIVAGATDTPRKFGATNIAGRTFGGSPFAGCQLRRATLGPSTTGYDQLRIGLDTGGTLSPPWDVTATAGAAGAGGVFASIGTKFYKLTATDAAGETTGSVEASVTLTATTQQVTLGWTPPAGATAIKVWRSTTTETYTPTALRAALSGASTSYIDDGSATITGSIPTDNTTGSGSAPTLEEGPIAVDPIPDGATVFFWVGRVVPIPAAPEDELAAVELVEF